MASRPSHFAPRPRRWHWAFAALLASTSAVSAEYVVNGGFEANGGAGSTSFTGWTLLWQVGSSGRFYAQSGAKAPRTPFAVPVPDAGNFAAMSDQSGPGTYLLYQDIALPAGQYLYLRARLFILNQARDFVRPSPDSLDYTVQPNQQARIDIMDPGATPADIGSGVLRNIYRTQGGDPATSNGYFSVGADLTALGGRTVRLRIAEVDNRQGLLFGIDSVSVHTVTPPGAPVILRLLGHNNAIEVRFNAPADDGGAPVGSYAASCTGGGHTYSVGGASSPLTVGGLANGTRYSCTVRATNLAGDGSSSIAVGRVAGGGLIAPLVPILLD